MPPVKLWSSVFVPCSDNNITCIQKLQMLAQPYLIHISWGHIYVLSYKNVPRCRDGEVRIQCALKQVNVDLTVRMSWYTTPYSYTFCTSWLFMQLLDPNHHSYISTGFGGKPFLVVSVVFIECQLHLMKVNS